ncbi:hypothetical protein DL764_001068 [Monosporascus ibericus]|uniref:Pathway-specific nitrogen regulator n=1 Tax=Monosporascus ibericus TaxID=155417 RepID=A0A4Q4TTI9_9PEZI|nr:hypothetical protein DL764_001068 [Monosporascus ibericus]
MDEETSSQSGELEQKEETIERQDYLRAESPEEQSAEVEEDESDGDSAHHPHSEEVLPSIETGEGGDSSSQHEATTDEDLFSVKSPRSSLGSYDGGSECGKGHEFLDNMTTAARSPRISDISQYDKEDFVPTIRGTPRSPFRTSSDIRAMQMSSPTQSDAASPRSGGRRYLPTVSRLASPSGSAQYSPKRTPPRLKPRKEAPLVLLHCTLLPLRWVWGDLVNGLEAAELSEEAKALRDAWRILQDRMGDTTCERGILLGHPQNDYEVLEERLLDALELPLRRRARILECGHYLGPANEPSTAGGGEGGGDYYSDSEYEYGSYAEDRPSGAARSSKTGGDRRHWCATCNSEIRYEALGPGRVFRVKVYASNGLMKADAWATCWREMERVDVEIEPIVQPAVQDELVRLAASKEEEADIAHEVAQQFKEEKKAAEKEKQRGRSRGETRKFQARVDSPSAEEAEMEPQPEERRRGEEERLREVYGDSAQPTAEEHPREATPEPHPDSYGSPPEEAYEHMESRRRKMEGASLPQLLLQSIRVLVQDRKNIAIIALSAFVVLLAVRSARLEPLYEPGLHGIVANMPGMQHVPVAEPPPQADFQDEALYVDPERSPSQDDALIEDIPAAEAPLVSIPELDAVVASEMQEAPEMDQAAETQEALEIQQVQEFERASAMPEDPVLETSEEPAPEEQIPVVESVVESVEPPSVEEECVDEPAVEETPMEECSPKVVEESAVEAAEMPVDVVSDEPRVVASQQTPAEASMPTETAPSRYTRCATPSSAHEKVAAPAVSKAPETYETEFETVTEKTFVRIIHTVTETEIQTEYVKVTATEVIQRPEPTSRPVDVIEEFDSVVCLDGEEEQMIEGTEEKDEPVIEDVIEPNMIDDNEINVEMRAYDPEMIEENGAADTTRACDPEMIDDSEAAEATRACDPEADEELAVDATEVKEEPIIEVVAEYETGETEAAGEDIEELNEEVPCP